MDPASTQNFQTEHREPESTLDVLVIGAGFAGVCTGIKLLEKGVVNFRIYEKSAGIGGTWYENTYPGAACDVPSHLYCFSFEPNPNWSRMYSPRHEIQAYIEHCADKYGVRPYIENGASLASLDFDEANGHWVAAFEDGRIVRARFVINGAGGLHKPLIPDFPGREDFAGASMHTARWDKAVETAGRRVAVIGSAASAIQAIPELARTSARVTVFQRTPNYIAPRMDRAYTDKEKRRFAKWPLLARLHRYKIFMRMELLLFPVTKKDSKQGRIGARRIMEWMRSQVKDPELQEQLVPDYALGCKRILISDNFYRTLNRENVELVTEGIEKIVPQGVVTSDGKLHAADVIVYATGFDIEGHMFSIPVRGRSGIPLTDSWKHLPEAYQGACTSGFPNYFMITGPNTGVSTTSVVFMIEHLLHYILELIDLADDDKIIEVTREAEDAYNQKLHAALENTVWATGGCKSWYRREDGKITTLYPYDARTFKRQVSKVKPDHFTLLGVPSTASPGA